MPPKIRLSFRPEHGGTEQVALCAVEYKSILKTAATKLRLGKKAIGRARLVVEATGIELRPNNPNLAKEISNGSVIIVYTSAKNVQHSAGTDNDNASTSKQSSGDMDLDLPPFAPSHCRGLECDESAEDSSSVTQQFATATLDEEEDSVPKHDNACESIQSDFCFEGRFPILEGNVLPLVRESIAGVSAFKETDFGDYVAFDYKDATSSSATFPDPWQQGQHRKSKERWFLALRRECRGLIICKHTGKVLRRPFHKFFNINEVDETAEDRVELTDDILLLEKIDGSLASPLVLTGRSDIQWATRKSLQPDLKGFCQKAEEDYEGLARFCIDHGQTPLFEWCVSGQAVGVVQHTESSVTLLTIRDMVTGSYLSRSKVESISQQFGVPCVKPLTLVNITAEAKHTTSMHDIVAKIAAEPAPLEGAVVVLKGGQSFYKIKTLWYVSMASASKRAGGDPWAFLYEFLKHRPSLEGMPRERLWKACLSDASGTDDSRATCLGLLKETDQARQLQHFIELCDDSVTHLHNQLCNWSSLLRTRLANQKESVDLEAIISKSSATCGWSRKVMRAYVSDANNTTSCLRHDLMQQRVEDLETFFGFLWDERSVGIEFLETQKLGLKTKLAEDQNASNNLQEQKSEGDYGERFIARSQLFEDESLDVPPKGIEDHVCSVYLLRKIAIFLGKSKASMMDETLIEIDSNYKGSEGKIKGLWESFSKKKIVDLRIDLQPPLASISDHNGNSEWALWLVQFGANKVSKNTSKVKDGYPSGNFAGVFVQTGCAHRYLDLRTAVRTSFQERRIVFLTSREGISRVPDLTQDDRIKYRDHIDGENGYKENSKASLSQSASWTFFIDLDGVLADFDAALLRASGKRSSDFANAAAMWRHIMSSERNFFARLPWTEHGARLWTFLQKAAQMESVGGIKILTGIPNTKSGGKNIIRQKIIWCNEHLGKDTEVIACSSNEKYKWGGPNCILIDDHMLHREKWEAAGGIFVHYYGNFAHVERYIRSLVFPDGGLNEEEMEAVSCVQERASHRKEGGKSFYVEENQIHYVKGTDGTKDDLFAGAVANLSNDAVGIDCEWRPDELSRRSGKYSAASVIQVAIRGSVFIIDTHEISPITRRALVGLFSPDVKAEWYLIFFGVDEDLNRIIAAVPEIATFHNLSTASTCVDLQRVFETLGLNKSGKNLISLSEMSERVAGYSLIKDRSVQAGDWSKRPLSPAQIQYAACDAQICTILWQAIAMEDCLREAILSSIAEAIVMPPTNVLQRYIRATNGQMQSATKEQNDGIELANPAPILSALPAGPVQPSYTAIFLSKQSTKTLLEAYPPQHRNVLADHITLAYAPKHTDLAGLPIGKQCRFRVSEIISDEKSQVARISFLDDAVGMSDFSTAPQTLHITMSTGINVPASRSSELLHLVNDRASTFDTVRTKSSVTNEVVEDMILEGTVGVLVQLTEDQNMLASLSKSVLGKLTEFAESKTPGSILKFRGGMLNPTERAAIHTFCEANGIISRSEGPKENRKLTLSFPKFLNESEGGIAESSNTGRIVQSALDLDEKTKCKQSKKLRSRDARNIASSYICLSMGIFMLAEWKDQNGDSSHVSPIGELGFNNSSGINVPEIHIDPDRQVHDASGSDAALLTSMVVSGKLPAEVPKPLVIIMRGLSGSGKSSWARALKEHCRPEQSVAIVSADDFFERNGSYKETFEQSKLSDAHDICRLRFTEELSDEKSTVVLVDNTNSRLAEYKFYTDMARNAGKRYLVVELLCRSESELQEFYHRGLHCVPMQAMGRMRARWENDVNSLLFTSATRESVDSSRLPTLPRMSESLRTWLAQNHMFHNIKARAKTYLNMSTDANESKFISVPYDLELEFLRRYAVDEGTWCLAEYATLPLFPFFCDIDQTYSDQSEAIDILSIASSLSAVLRRLWEGSRRSSIIVVGKMEERDKNGNFKLGCHLHCPSTIVSREEASKIRALLVEELARDGSGIKDWDKIVDPSIYEHMTLRLLGSSKPGPMKRVYDLIGVIGVEGHTDFSRESQYRRDRLQLLLDCSVRLKDASVDPNA